MQRIGADRIPPSRLEAARLVHPTLAVPDEPLLEQALAGGRRDAEARHSELVREIAPDLPAIAADPGQILQLLDNLLTNALRYGEPGTPVTLAAEAEDGMVHVAVADRGEGIPPEHLARVTERFYRVDTSRSRSIGGTGLGLSIVKHIVERHRGRLTIESRPGAGTTVHVRLPIAGPMSQIRHPPGLSRGAA
jgi:two-component system phosphate regulon sensor histidine kinase PhoR